VLGFPVQLFGKGGAHGALIAVSEACPGCQEEGERDERGGCKTPRRRGTKGHLPGAVHLGKGIIERDIEQRVPDTSAKLILYCGGGFRSALAAENLQKMGYTNVESMDGGWKGWLDAGLPTAKD
jgi:3-mercaptopyruvate sulfurtransferase SseA